MKSVAILIIALILSAVMAPDHHANEGVGLAHGLGASSSQVNTDQSSNDTVEQQVAHTSSDQPQPDNDSDSPSEEGHFCHVGHCPAVLIHLAATPETRAVTGEFPLSNLFVNSVDLAGLRRPPRA